MSEPEKPQYPEPPVRPKNRKLTHPWRGHNPGLFASSKAQERPDGIYPFKQGMTKLNRAR